MGTLGSRQGTGLVGVAVSYVMLSVSTIEWDSFVDTHRMFIICCLIIIGNDIGTCRDLLNVFV